MEQTTRNLEAASRRHAPALLVFAAVVLLSFSEGGYFRVSWGWSSLGFLLVVFSVLFVTGRVELSRAEAAFVGTLGLLVAWIAASAVWSESVPRTVAESERGLVYVTGAAALLSLASARGHLQILGGLFAALFVVCGYGLGSRLLPDLFGFHFTLGNRLAEPLGYWNGLGLLAAMGIVLALGLAAHAPSRMVRAVAAGGTPLFVTTLYFTTSRGGWLALAASLLVGLILDPRRLRLAATALALVPPSALALLLASRAENLAGSPSTIAAAASDGHRLAAALFTLALVAALVPTALGAIQARFTIAPGTRRLASRSLIAVTIIGAVVGVIAAGGPSALAGRAYDSFRGPVAAGGELDERLFTFSGNGRSEYWSVAWDAYRANPWVGSGAGTYEFAWYRDRTSAFGARDAHNLYLEVLSELGPVGLLLIAGALAMPLIALGVGGREPLTVAAAAAYVAFLFHAALDWDWELPAVTLAGLSAGSVALVAARSRVSSVVIDGRARAATLVVVAVLSSAAFVVQVGNGRLASGESALADGRHLNAIRDARDARRWLPWDSEPWRLEGEAELAQGDGAEARKSLLAAIDRDPSDWRLWYGLALATTGDERKGAAARVRALNPREPGIRDLIP